MTIPITDDIGFGRAFDFASNVASGERMSDYEQSSHVSAVCIGFRIGTGKVN